MRLFYRLRFAWRTRHWNRDHFPGCPVRYGTSEVCLDPDFLCDPDK